MKLQISSGKGTSRSTATSSCTILDQLMCFVPESTELRKYEDRWIVFVVGIRRLDRAEKNWVPSFPFRSPGRKGKESGRSNSHAQGLLCVSHFIILYLI